MYNSTSSVWTDCGGDPDHDEDTRILNFKEFLSIMG